VEKQKLADIVKEIRSERGDSQEDLGMRLGVSQTTIRNWEQARTWPTIDNLIAIAEVWGQGDILQLLAVVKGEQQQQHPKPKVAEDMLSNIRSLDKTEQVRLLHLIVDIVAG
jgi:transcriptional regulator with XRE-family HTH domain